jgi:hypothetical protein
MSVIIVMNAANAGQIHRDSERGRDAERKGESFKCKTISWRVFDFIIS